MDCTACGEPNREDARFCNLCGHTLSPGDASGDQRRVVTVLFADLVGFTSMSEGEDPERIKNLVDDSFEQLVEVIDRHGGRVDKIIGDAILALFGAPTAHEDDAERAVRAALSMQEVFSSQMADHGDALRLRVGVNTGEVLVGALRSGGSYTAMGDVVNTAQRLESGAEPGAVLVGPATHAATADRVTYEPMGEISARGRDEPVEAWLAVDTVAPPGRRDHRVDGPLVGRRSELAVIDGAVDLAFSRGRSQFLLLVGDAGVGKSRLVAEATAHAADHHDAWVLEGRCVPYGEANVWWPVAEALGQAAGIDPDGDPDEVRASTSRLVQRFMGFAGDDPELARVTNGLLSLLGHEDVRDVDPTRARAEAARSLVEVTTAAARHRPVIVVLSDLHWADEVVLDLLDQLLPEVSRHPYVVIGTARHGIHDRWSPGIGRHNTTVLHVEPLDQEPAAALLTILLGREPEPELRDELLDRSGGNPFYLEELVSLLDETELLPAVAAGEAPSGDLAGVPDTLRGLVTARLDALTDEERAVLEDAAVLGRRGPIDGLALMADQSRGHSGTAAAVEALVDKELFRVDDDDHYEFRSDLVRDCAYATLTKTHRAARHAGIAAYLDGHHAEHHGGVISDGMVDRLAYHYGTAARLVQEMGAIAEVERLAPDVGDKALRWIGTAAQRAVDDEHHAIGRRLYDEALGLLGSEPGPPRRLALLGRARCRAAMREFDGARDDTETAMSEAVAENDRAAEGRALTVLGDLESKQGESEAALATLQQAVAILEEQEGEDEALGEALRLRGMTELFTGDREGARQSIRLALDLARTTGDRRGEAWALQNLAWLAFEEGRADDADRRLEESATAFREVGDNGGLGWALGLQAWVKMQKGDLEGAAHLAERVLPATSFGGDEWAGGMLHLLLASVRLWSGQAEASLEHIDHASEQFVALGDQSANGQALATRGRALVLLGRIDEAWPLFDEAVDMANEDGGSVTWVGVIGGVLGSVTVGDPERAQHYRKQALLGDLDKRIIGEDELRAGLALAAVQLDQPDDALELLSRAPVPEEEWTPSVLAVLAMSRVAAGEHDAARAAADRVVGSDGATPLDRTTARVALALAEAASGAPDRAEAALDDADGDLADTDYATYVALVSLARAELYAATGDHDRAAGERVDADARWAAVGVEPTGWLRAFASVLGAPEPATTA